MGRGEGSLGGRWEGGYEDKGSRRNERRSLWGQIGEEEEDGLEGGVLTAPVYGIVA